jgi:hypothetical protein
MLEFIRAMAKLIGAQRMVLQAILDAQGESEDFVDDTRIAQTTRIALKDVRDWLQTLEGKEFIQVARTEAGLSASITADGRQALRQFRPFTNTTPPPTVTSGSTSASSGKPNTEKPDAGKKAVLQPIRLFYSYSHKDETLRDELEEHLSLLKRQGYIIGWHDRRIGAGEEWRGQLDRNLEEAQVILLLISPSFLASDYCYDIETKRALERHEQSEAKVIPILLRPCDWKGAPFGKLQGLPIDLKPVTSWLNRDEAFTNVAQGIRRIIEDMAAKSP